MALSRNQKRTLVAALAVIGVLFFWLRQRTVDERLVGTWLYGEHFYLALKPDDTYEMYPASDRAEGHQTGWWWVKDQSLRLQPDQGGWYANLWAWRHRWAARIRGLDPHWGVNYWEILETAPDQIRVRTHVGKELTMPRGNIGEK